MSLIEPTSSEPFLNAFTSPLLEILKRHPKRIVFPEGEDLRVIRVAALLVAEQAVAPILLGNKEKIRGMAAEAGISLQFVRVIEPEKSSDLTLFCERFERIERLRGNPSVDALSVMTRPHFFAAMMVQYGQADAMVAGNQIGAAGVYRTAMRMIKPAPEGKGIFGVSAAVVPDFVRYGKEGIIFLADTGVVNEPSVEILANHAVATGQLAFHLLGRPVRVAMLSSSTRRSNPHPASERVAAAAVLAQSIVSEKMLTDKITIEGEIQLDAALDPEACGMRCGVSSCSADVLIFPDLDSADIVVKLFELMSDVHLYGLFLAGLALPVVQIPRQACLDQIFGSTLVAGIEAIKFHQVHPEGSADVY